VVLPLDNPSNDPAQEYFTEGMTEELINSLAKVQALRVISRTSAMTYKGAHKSLPQIARELNVDAVVEGSVLQSGGRVRITVQLFEAKTERSLWAHSYQQDLGDVLTLQSEVASAIVNEIQVKLTPGEKGAPGHNANRRSGSLSVLLIRALLLEQAVTGRYPARHRVF